MRPKINFMPFLEARDFVRSLKIRSTRELDSYSKGYRPHNIPGKPNVNYRNCGWISWSDWLGYEFISSDIRYRKHIVNDDYFKTWSHNMAYILGFWFADGCMRKGNIFTITQHEKDKYLLEGILKEMGSNNRLLKYQNCYSFKIFSKSIYDDIIKLGGKERKSLNVEFPNVPKEHLPDFIRGLWDGDGCISYNKHNKAHISTYASGSKLFVEKMHLILKNNILNFKGSIHKNKKDVYHLMLAKNDTIKLRDFIYQEPLKDKLMLKRKYNLFQETEDFCVYEFINYSDAQRNMRENDINNRLAWRNYCKEGLKPHNIPSTPDIVYKNTGWVDWSTWFSKSVL